jgi:hypothetical protein
LSAPGRYMFYINLMLVFVYIKYTGNKINYHLRVFILVNLFQLETISSHKFPSPPQFLLQNFVTKFFQLIYYYYYYYCCCCYYYFCRGYAAPCWALVSVSVSQPFTQWVGLLGWGISPSQGSYLYTKQHKHRVNTHRHSFFKWDLNPRPLCLSGRIQFVP